MSNKVLKPKKPSLYEFTQNYSNNINNCIEFFKSMKWPDGFSCDHCGCHKYYLVKRLGKTKTSYVLEYSSCHKQQLILGILSTDKENNYPRLIKLILITDYTGLSLKKNIEKCCVLSHDALLNTDGEKGFNTLNEEIQVKNEKISYEEKDHRLLWLNIIIGNSKNNITGIYHGINKREMPLFLNE
jgi:hypothetical protein